MKEERKGEGKGGREREIERTGGREEGRTASGEELNEE